MSQTSIGRAALVLTTNGAGLRSGLADETQHINRWADTTAKGVETRFGKMRAAAASAFKAIPGPVTSAAVAIGAGTLAIKAAAETLDDLAKQGAAAKAFGLTAEQFTSISGLAKSVGGDTRELVESLVTLQKLGTEGAAGKGEVAPQFFKDLNLDAKAFTALRLDEQFYKVFESIKAMNSEGEQVRALMTAFGEDGGKNLLPLLSKSGAEIRQLAAGFAISGQQVQIATRAAESFSRAQITMQQLWRRIAVAAAPVLEFIARELTATVNQFARMETTAVPALAKVLRMTAQLADATKAVTAATLIATGVRLKFLTAEVVARSVIWGASKGGPLGAAAAGALATVAMEATIGPEMRAAGSVLLNLGTKLLDDVGGSTKRVEKFITELESRSSKPGVMGRPGTGGGVMPEAAPPSPLVKLQDNAALLKGSAAEVSARLRNEFGGKTASALMLEEQRKGNGHLKDINAGVKALGAKPAGVELLPL